MSGIGFELHRLLKSERREHQAAAARQSSSRATAPWIPPMILIGASGLLTTLALGKSTELEDIASLFIGIVTVSMLASVASTAAIARIASDPLAQLVRPLVLANLIATAFTVLLLLLIWPLFESLFSLPMTQSAAFSAVLLANIWPPIVALVLRRRLRDIAVPVIATVLALIAIWFAIQYQPSDIYRSRLDIALCSAVIAASFGTLIGLALRLDDEIKPEQRSTPYNRIDYTAWAPALFTLMLIGDRLLLSLSEHSITSMLHASAPSMIGMLCVLPALWYLVKYIEPTLCQHRAKLMTAVYEGESLEHIEQELDNFANQSDAGLNTLAKMLGVSAIAGFLIGPELLAVLELNPNAIIQLQFSIVSSAMLTHFLGSIALLWLMQLRFHVFCATLVGSLFYTALAITAIQSEVLQPALAATLAACMTSLLTFTLVRQCINTLAVHMLLD